MVPAIAEHSGLLENGCSGVEEKILGDIELLPSNQSISSTLRTWTLRWPHRGKTVAKLLLANEQNAFMVRELVAVWLYFREAPPADSQTQQNREVSVLITKFSEYWCLLESLRHASSIESLWKVVSKFCRGEFVKRTVSPDPSLPNALKYSNQDLLEHDTAPQWANSPNKRPECPSSMNGTSLKDVKETTACIMDISEGSTNTLGDDDMHDSGASTDEDEAAAQGLWMWWQHARAAAHTGLQHFSNTAAHTSAFTAAAAKRLRSG